MLLLFFLENTEVLLSLEKNACTQHGLVRLVAGKSEPVARSLSNLFNLTKQTVASKMARHFGRWPSMIFYAVVVATLCLSGAICDLRCGAPVFLTYCAVIFPRQADEESS